MTWPMVKLCDVAPAKPIKAPKFSDPSAIWLLNLDMIESNTGKVIEKITCPLDEVGASTHCFDQRHVLYSKLRPYLNKVILPDEPGLATTELVPMLPDPKRLDRKYLAYYLRSEKFVRWVNEQVAGAKMPRVSMNIFWKHEIPLPPLAEQKRIAEILDKADAIRQKRQQAIALADQFLRSVFLDMFGDPVTNPKGWEIKPLKMFTRITTGNTPSRKDPDNYGDHIEWIKSDNINTPFHYLTVSEEKLSEKGIKIGRTAQAGAVLMTCIAGSLSCIGNVALSDRIVAFNQQINAMEPTDISTSEYIYCLMLVSKKIIQENSNNAMKGMLSKGTLSEIKFPCPPIETQQKFSEKIKQCLSIINKQHVHLQKLNKNFSSLTKKAFSAQL